MKRCSIRQYSDQQCCVYCHKSWDCGDYDGKCGLRPIEPSPEEVFWYNMARASLTLVAACFTIIAVWLMQPGLIPQLVAEILSWWAS